MKFIVDAQLPKSLSDFLNRIGYDSVHTIDLPDSNKTKDSKIILLSKKEKRIIITKDSDFLETFLLSGKPQKLIIVKTGNIRNTELLNLFENNIDIIAKSIEENSMIEINKSEVIVHV